MYLIIINPREDRGQFILSLRLLTAHFDAAGLDYEAYITTGHFDGYEKTKKFLERHPECKAVIVMGSDLITQEVVAALVDTFPESREGQKIPIHVGLMPPYGCSNFGSSLEGGRAASQAKYRIEQKTAAKNFFDTLMKGKLRPIDVITANGMGFLNIGHVGLDATVAKNAEELKPKYQDLSYFIAAFKTIFNYENIALEIETTDGEAREKLQGKFVCAVICNGQYYGSDMRIAPEAKIDDGKITFGLIRPMGLKNALPALINVFKGRAERVKHLSFITCDRVKITLPPTILCLDGNLYPKDGEIEFKILPKVLEVFV